jgi:hypothetical protein
MTPPRRSVAKQEAVLEELHRLVECHQRETHTVWSQPVEPTDEPYGWNERAMRQGLADILTIFGYEVTPL